MLNRKKKSKMIQSKLLLKSKGSIGIVYRINTSKAVKLAEEVAAYLKDKGHTVYTAPEQKAVKGTKIATKKQMDDLMLMIVLGGDGTYLRAVRILQGRKVPIVGFNMGSLGFLTVYNADTCFDIIDKALAGKLAQRPRAMIHAKIYRHGKMLSEHHALNDIVIERGSNSQLINTLMYSEDFLVSQVKADGFIVSSPSGSTAYNLAAGGPILHPQVRVLVVTPVAPHSLTSRPFLVPDDRDLTFKLVGKGTKAHFVVDGQAEDNLVEDDEIIITRSCYDHLIVREPDHNYFEVLRNKLRFGDRD